MRQKNALDFPDLIRRAISLLTLPEHQEAVGDRVRRRFSYIMVDEFQDTTSVQMEVSVCRSGKGWMDAWRSAHFCVMLYGFMQPT